MDKLNPADRKFLIALLNEKLKAVKSVDPHSVHSLAVQAYRIELIKRLKKLDPKGHWY